MIRLTPIPALAAALVAGIALPATAQDTRAAAAAAQYDVEFTATDTNHDGVLTRAEIQARILKMQASGKKIDPLHAKRMADLWFDHADTNKDGKVTRAEGQALLTKMMDSADASRRAAAGR